MTEIHNKTDIRERRKELRKRQTNAESELWKYIRGKRFDGFKFKRQHSLGFYIADFYCAKAKLIIEIDGDSHFTEDGIKYDKQRTIHLN